MSVTFLNPDSLVKSPAFSQAVTVTGAAKTVYIGAQNAVDGAGNLVGAGDLAAQTEQTLKNIDACLEAAGARREHIISWNIYVVAGQDLMAGAQVGMRWLAGVPNPPLNNVMFVSGFWPPERLVQIDAIAVVPE
ncbi:MAG TPA: RidA family protein [Dehalococcoidia bacterium]|nr:RidA family protein [Dehalococcoidia bacterium]